MAGTASMRLFQSTFPAGEATYDNNPILKWCMTFQSTLPVGEATPFMPEHRLEEHISIHAFRGESDLSGTTTISAANDFNPRFPRGKRRDKKEAYLDAYKFQSTPPAGEATRKSRPGLTSPTFQSTLPVGEATEEVFPSIPQVEISIHASRGGSDCVLTISRVVATEFQSTLPAGEATDAPMVYRGQCLFQSTLPAGEATHSHSKARRTTGNFNPRFPRGKRHFPVPCLEDSR